MSTDADTSGTSPSSNGLKYPVNAAAAPDRMHVGRSDISSPSLTPSSSSTSFPSSPASSMHLNAAAAAHNLTQSDINLGSSDHLSAHSHSPSPSPSPSYPPLGAAPQRFNERSLTAVAPRSSSLPLSMGTAYSKTTPPPPASPSTSAASKGINAAVAGGIKLKRAFAGRRSKKSEDTSAMFSRNAMGREQDSRQYEQHRTEPASSSPASAQVSPSASSCHAQPKGAKLQLSQLATHVFHKKSAKSPQEGLTSPAPPPPPKSTTARHNAPLPMQLGTQQQLSPESSSTPNQRSSIIPISPGISSAVNFMRMGAEEEERQREKAEEPVKAEKTEQKEAWRKSDSTNSHHTIRPGAVAANRASRPVSMAESFHSTHTIVPVNKRLSALITDADFGMPEEDDDSFQSMDEISTTSSSTSSISSSTNNRNNIPTKASSTPSAKLNKRRSMSLNLGSPFMKTPIPAYPPSASATELKHPSHSISEGVPPLTPPASMRENQNPLLAPHAHAQHTNSQGFISQASAAGEIRGRLHNVLAPSTSSSTASRDRNLPALPPHTVQHSQSQASAPLPSFRQTAISMTSGFAPAAGLAKRAVEKMGRAWGGISSSSSNSGYSSSSSSNTAPSSFSSASHMHDYALARTNSNQSTSGTGHGHGHSAANIYNHLKGHKQRRTPNSPSGSYSVTSSMTSGSDSDAYIPPPGPVLGRMVRPPLKLSSGAVATGVVFKRDLRTVVRETAVGVGCAPGSVDAERGVPAGREELKELEQRRLPALVVRCAQHLLIWGVQEEGLFRVSGRPSHVSKLRVEFDTGADYDMMECTPGDLDPHAVASVFKSFLRDLPEALLTNNLVPYFEAAISQESSNNPAESFVAARSESKGPGLPTGPRAGGQLPAIRKPPSLSTLAMPSFAGMRPPSASLLKALRALVAQLPEENRDLIRTLIELIKATAAASKVTKMPLSNLLLLFCPSLNMSPPLLRILCEADGIWIKEKEVPVLDIKRETVYFDISAPSTARPSGSDEGEHSQEDAEEQSVQSSRRTSEDHPSSDYDASAEGSLLIEDNDPQRRWTAVDRPDVPTVYLDCQSRASSASVSSTGQEATHSRDVSVTSSSPQDDASLSSDGYSAVLPNPHALPPPPLSLSAESVATPSTSSGQQSLPHLPLENVDDLYMPSKTDQESTGAPKIADLTPLSLNNTSSRRPMISNPVPVNSPVQFPSSSVENIQPPQISKRRSIPILSLPSFSPLSSSSQPPSPADSTSSQRGLRTKKPSLRLLFSKRSSASLSGLVGTSTTRPIISSPMTQPGAGPYMQNRAASDSSVSTPISAVTAPQSSLPHLPPVLDTPIEGSSLGFELGLEVSPPSTSSSDRNQGTEGDTIDRETTSLSIKVGQTPIADQYRFPSAASSQTSLVSVSQPGVSQLRPNPIVRGRGASVSSTASSNHLGLLDDADSEEEDWTNSVLLAADVNGQWSIQHPSRA
ncbi:hypothetical protein BDQ12DRAFT_717378 [Crucibulum laeve]|uniref:Rho-GAP domain-containing protein n=1 Tax=Crucibulum laeve TaxID=68775 RepID=A0A5C3MIL6_9AGAR|nr:hypothetical protein BDQ12DRAFT_717378 [Crucibulum laeve]